MLLVRGLAFWGFGGRRRAVWGLKDKVWWFGGGGDCCFVERYLHGQ
jgi:hypothetical protein